jgi:hypothetical protein
MTVTISDQTYMRVSQRFELMYTMQGKNLTDTSYIWPPRSHVRQPSTKSLLSWIWDPGPGMKSWPPVIVRLGRHHGMPHSFSNNPPQSKKVRFNKVVTGLLDLSGTINPICGQYKSKLVHQDQNDVILNQCRRGLPPWNLGIAMALSSPFPSKWSNFPNLPRRVHQQA